MNCRFCKAPAVARFAMEKGCFCYPEDRVQALCPQHVIDANPVGEMGAIEVLDASLWAWMASVGLVQPESKLELVPEPE